MAEVDQMATEQLTSHGKIDLKDNFFDYPYTVCWGQILIKGQKSDQWLP